MQETPQKIIKIICEQFAYEANSTENMTSHLNTAHKPTCSHCYRTFLSVDDLGKHMNDDHNFKCTDCEED